MLYNYYNEINRYLLLKSNISLLRNENYLKMKFYFIIFYNNSPYNILLKLIN